MAKLNLLGQVKQIGSVEEYGQNGFKKRELILKTVEEYPNVYIIEFTGNNVDLLDSAEVGKNVKVTCKLAGREHTNDEGKYNVFMSLKGWNIEPII